MQCHLLNLVLRKGLEQKAMVVCMWGVGGGGVIDGESEIMFLCIFHIKQQSRFGRAVDKEYCIGW